MEFDDDNAVYVFVKGFEHVMFPCSKELQTEENVIKAIRMGMDDVDLIKIPITDRIAKELVVWGI